MRIAVPLFGKDIAPRYVYADLFLIAHIEDGQIQKAYTVRLDFLGWPSRLNQLKNLGVDTILCGGFNRWFVPLAEELGLNVIAGNIGDACQVVEAFARGDLIATTLCGGKRRERRANRQSKGRQGQGRGRRKSVRSD